MPSSGRAGRRGGRQERRSRSASASLEPSGKHRHASAATRRCCLGSAAIRSSLMSDGRLGSCSSPATISSPTRCVQQLCLNVPTRFLSCCRLDCGFTLWQTAAAGVQADRGGGPSQSGLSSPESRTLPTSSGGPVDDARFVGVFAHALEHADGYTPDDAKGVARPRRRTSCAMTLAARRASRTMAGHSPTTSPSFFCAMLPEREGDRDKVGPHGDLLHEFPDRIPPHGQRPPFGSS